MTQIEIDEIKEKAKILTNLNVTEFLLKIKEKAEKWKKDLKNGS